LHVWKNIRLANIDKTAFVIMNSLVDYSDSSQSPKGPQHHVYLLWLHPIATHSVNMLS